MEYVIGEIVLCLLAVAALAAVLGWLLHGLFGQGKIRAMEASKNLEIEQVQGELGSAVKARQEASAALETSKARLKELEAAAVASAQQLTTAKTKHENEVGDWKQRIAALEPLTGVVAERESRIDAWRQRFDGLVQEKDKALAAAGAELAEHKSKLGALGLTLAASTAEKDAL